MHRTQSEFDDNLTFKVFLFQFINFYSSIFYLADISFFEEGNVEYGGVKVDELEKQHFEHQIVIKLPLGLVNLEFIYSEKATKFCKIFPLLLTTVHTVKSKGKILQKFVAFSKYMNFKS